MGKTECILPRTKQALKDWGSHLAYKKHGITGGAVKSKSCFRQDQWNAYQEIQQGVMGCTENRGNLRLSFPQSKTYILFKPDLWIVGI